MCCLTQLRLPDQWQKQHHAESIGVASLVGALGACTWLHKSLDRPAWSALDGGRDVGCEGKDCTDLPQEQGIRSWYPMLELKPQILVSFARTKTFDSKILCMHELDFVPRLSTTST